MLHSRGKLLLMLDADGAPKVDDVAKLENQVVLNRRFLRSYIMTSSNRCLFNNGCMGCLQHFKLIVHKTVMNVRRVAPTRAYALLHLIMLSLQLLFASIVSHLQAQVFFSVCMSEHVGHT